MKYTLDKVADDLIEYIDHMRKLGNELHLQEDKDKLANIFGVIMSLLIALKKSSGIGLFKSPLSKWYD